MLELKWLSCLEIDEKVVDEVRCQVCEDVGVAMCKPSLSDQYLKSHLTAYAESDVWPARVACVMV